jgi:ADP-ribose pyrophosphatase YjhB (NUDIX family)
MAGTVGAVPVPDFVLQLRRHVGHAPLWLPGVTAVVLRGDEVLLGRRTDNNQWTPITGIVDPGEQPAAAAEREVLEEAAVVAVAERLSSVHAEPELVHPNGDRALYLDHTFRCRYVSGDARVGDEESTAVGWFPLSSLPLLGEKFRVRIACAVADDPAARFDR